METSLEWTQSLAWLQNHFHFVVLAAFMLIQWILLQGFIVHYALHRPRAQSFKRERGQIEMLEKLVGFQANQIERLYAKLAEVHREVQTTTSAREAAKATGMAEASMVSFGEVALKKRLTELSQVGLSDNAASKKIH